MSNYAVVDTATFRADLRRVAGRDAARFEDILAAFEAAAILLRRFPYLGHRVQIDGVWSPTERSWPVDQTGYLIRYRVEQDRERIVLLRFRHEAQRPLKR
jgi:plasmid stabilization system protein ParE